MGVTGDKLKIGVIQDNKREMAKSGHLPGFGSIRLPYDFA